MTSRIAVGAALLCMTVFILHEQRRIHELDVARNETSATVDHSREDHHSLSRAAERIKASPTNWRLGKLSEQQPHLFALIPNLCYRNAGNRPVVQPDSRITTTYRVPNVPKWPLIGVRGAHSVSEVRRAQLLLVHTHAIHPVQASGYSRSFTAEGSQAEIL